MITIVEPERPIDRLWGKQQIKETLTYRMMQYVFRVVKQGKVLLHNVVTGQLVVLEEDEIDVVDNLPMKYNPVMQMLVNAHYLVPMDWDDHQQVIKLRTILWKLSETQSSKDITYYTILPTTACNARCWYCFEQGVKVSTMTEQTADDVVDFIADHCGDSHVTIRWFGGEPTIATNRIDRICEGLSKRKINFTSFLTTNGYLLNKELITRAKTLWNLELVTISVDGTEKHTNNIKSFINVQDNPYRTVLQNISFLLEQEIYVGLRMNFDENNYNDFADLISEAELTFGTNPFLQVSAHHINKDLSRMDPAYIEALEKWYNQKLFELNNLSRVKGFYRRKVSLPSLFFHMCEAASERALTITPEGNFVSCGEQLGDDQIKGNLKQGVTNWKIVNSWKRFADYEKCRDCVFFPDCPIIVNYNGKDRCYRKLEKTKLYEEEIGSILLHTI